MIIYIFAFRDIFYLFFSILKRMIFIYYKNKKNKRKFNCVNIFSMFLSKNYSKQFPNTSNYKLLLTIKKKFSFDFLE
jgi:hypothetical protein